MTIRSPITGWRHLAQVEKQPNSRYCFLCGLENPIGLKLAFYADEANRVITRYVPDAPHQGYPGILHGGIICALLDETIGRTLLRENIWAMTVELNVRFCKPVPLGQPITVVGEIVRLRSRTWKAAAKSSWPMGASPLQRKPSTYASQKLKHNAFARNLAFGRSYRMPIPNEPIRLKWNPTALSCVMENEPYLCTRR